MWVNVLLKAVLFILFVPGVHFNVPGTLKEQALIHGVFFAIANYLVYLYVRPLFERFKNPDTRADQPCPPGSVKGANGDCRVQGDKYGPFQ